MWYRQGIFRILKETNNTARGFSDTLNCDCIYDPLYGRQSCKMSVEFVDKILMVKEDITTIMTVERKIYDGVDEFLEVSHAGAEGTFIYRLY